jgi:PBP1b-binding outer membrane lipoprotein LpoB
MKNLIKKIISIFIILIITWLFSSCNYTKKENKNKTKTNTSIVDKKSTEKEAKKSMWKIKDANISKHWAWSARGGNIINKK